MSVLHRSIELLEPYDGKLSCTVLRGKAPVRVPTYPIRHWRPSSTTITRGTRNWAEYPKGVSSTSLILWMWSTAVG